MLKNENTAKFGYWVSNLCHSVSVDNIASGGNMTSAFFQIEKNNVVWNNALFPFVLFPFF